MLQSIHTFLLTGATLPVGTGQTYLQRGTTFDTSLHNNQLPTVAYWHSRKVKDLYRLQEVPPRFQVCALDRAVVEARDLEAF